VDEVKREEVTRLLKRGLNHYGLGDLEAAIAEGSTLVRVGTAIFGPRAL